MKGSKHKDEKPVFSILLIEDHTMVRLLAKQLLLKNNFEVDAVEDGETALLMALEKEYDLILMDLKLPNLDGFNTTKIIRALRNRNSNIPILALTSSAKEEVLEQMSKAGLTDYIGKPFEASEVLRKINYYLNH